MTRQSGSSFVITAFNDDRFLNKNFLDKKHQINTKKRIITGERFNKSEAHSSHCFDKKSVAGEEWLISNKVDADFAKNLKKTFNLKNAFESLKKEYPPIISQFQTKLFENEKIDPKYLELLDLNLIKKINKNKKTQKKIEDLKSYIGDISDLNSFHSNISSYLKKLKDEERIEAEKTESEQLKDSIQSFEIAKEKHICTAPKTVADRQQLTKDIFSKIEEHYLLRQELSEKQIPVLRSSRNKPSFVAYDDSEDLLVWVTDSINPYELCKSPKFEKEIQKMNFLIDKYSDIYFGTDFNEEGLYTGIDKQEEKVKKPSSKVK